MRTSTRWTFAGCWVLGSLFLACGSKRASQPAPAPEAQQSKPASESEDSFFVSTESFADARILRYRVPSFEALSLAQKTLLYYLQEAALSGRDITYDQGYEHNLLVRRTLEGVVRSYGGERNEPAFQALLEYLKRVWLANGIHHYDSSKKMRPEGLTDRALTDLIIGTQDSALPLTSAFTKATLAAEVARILFDDHVAPKSIEKDQGRDSIADSANHFYVGLTRAEVESWRRQRTIADDPTPVSVGLNSQLMRGSDGQIEERTWKVSGMYDEALRECVRWLEKAVDVAETPEQREALTRLVTFYRSGKLEDWDRYSIAWVEDTHSRIDLIHGFVETYGDPLGMRGTYEALLEIEDEAATGRIRALSSDAQWFEDHSPIQDEYKKPNVIGVSARVVEAVLGAGAAAPIMPGGINLPNASWIRQKHGSKSVTIGNVLAAIERANRDNGVLEEFTSGPRELERARKNAQKASELMVDLHEVVGHASGRLAADALPASETLRQYANTLEEARADLVALYFLLDPKLVELKLMSSLDVGRAAYDSFVRAALLVQLARVASGDSLEEAHMRGRQLIAAWALEQGAEDGVIERLSRGGKTYFAVRDYVKLRALFGKLLREVQRIKSQGDFESARELVESYGVKVDETLRKEVEDRHTALGVAPFVGFIQPELSPVMKDGAIVDVQITYPEDFATQQLGYSARYSFLPVHN